jgi:hypothetical protein
MRMQQTAAVSLPIISLHVVFGKKNRKENVPVIIIKTTPIHTNCSPTGRADQPFVAGMLSVACANRDCRMWFTRSMKINALATKRTNM